MTAAQGRSNRLCECGCGGEPVMGRFVKGHNSKLRGRRDYPLGTRGKYRHGCRCDECRNANRIAKNEQARRRGVLPFHEAMALRRKPKPVRIPITRGERFISAVTVDESGCWLWAKSLNHGGYGVTWNGTRTVVAHRFAYEMFVGPIPDGLHLDHLCRVRHCVNPDHLEPVTQAENNRRSWQARKASA